MLYMLYPFYLFVPRQIYILIVTKNIVYEMCRVFPDDIVTVFK